VVAPGVHGEGAARDRDGVDAAAGIVVGHEVDGGHSASEREVHLEPALAGIERRVGEPGRLRGAVSGGERPVLGELDALG
jgi:hypothetical protein